LAIPAATSTGSGFFFGFRISRLPRFCPLAIVSSRNPPTAYGAGHKKSPASMRSGAFEAQSASLDLTLRHRQI
jgi:hypothetical protein